MTVAHRVGASRTLIAAVVFVCSCNSVSALADDWQTDAFILAIQHFDPQSTKGIRFDGSEVRFTSAALAAAVEAVPELSGIHIRTMQVYGPMYQPRDLVSLQVLDPHSEFPEFSGDWGYIQGITDEVFSGCRGERITEEQDGVQGRWSTIQKWAWWLCGGPNKAESDTSCASAAAVSWLCAAGIRSAWAESWEGDARQKTGSLFLNFEQPVDLRYEAARIVALPGYEEIFGAARLRPILRMITGDGDEIRVVESSEWAGYQGTTLLFSHGWGDCPSGCLQRHNWVVRIKSRFGKMLVVGVEESGDALPARMREALRAGVSRME